MKRVLWIALVWILLLALAACGPQEATLVRIQVNVDTLPETYQQGTTPDTQSATITLYYSNGETATVPLSDAVMSEKWSNEIGPHTVVFEYNGVRCPYSYTVSEPPVSVQKATVEGTHEYEFGEEFAAEGTFTLNGVTYRLADYAAALSVQGFNTQSEGDKICTITLEAEMGQVQLTYAYSVKPAVAIERVEWLGEQPVAAVGQSAQEFLSLINQTPFVIYNGDDTSEQVKAFALVGYSADQATDSATCLARVSNKSHQTYEVTITYRVERHYATATVTYHLNYDTYGSTTAATVNGYAVRPTLLARNGYTLVWATADNIPFDFDTPVETDIDLYAVWQKQQYTIGFVDGGSLADVTITYYIDSNVTIDPLPTKAGCEFVELRWNEQVVPTSWGPDTYWSDMQLTVIWLPNQYNITYKLQDSLLYPAQNDNPATYKAYQFVDLQQPVRAGYRFAGWTVGTADGTPTEDISQDLGDITLYAHWTPNTYVLSTVNADNGNVIATRNIYPGENTTAVAKPTLPNYRFGGWYYDLACTNALTEKEGKYYLPAGIKTDIVIYARASRVYTIYLDKVYDGEERVVTIEFAVGDEDDEQQNYRYCKAWLDASTRFGCDKAVWLSQDGTLQVAYNDGPDVATQNLAAYDGQTLTAQWTGHTHYLYYHYNWANNGKEIVTQTYNTLDTVQHPVNPNRPGYVFDGWTMTDSDSAHRVEGFAPCAYDTDLHLYARWVQQ